MAVKPRKDTEEQRRFWDGVEEAARQVAERPEWLKCQAYDLSPRNADGGRHAAVSEPKSKR